MNIDTLKTELADGREQGRTSVRQEAAKLGLGKWVRRDEKMVWEWNE